MGICVGVTAMSALVGGESNTINDIECHLIVNHIIDDWQKIAKWGGLRRERSSRAGRARVQARVSFARPGAAIPVCGQQCAACVVLF